MGPAVISVGRNFLARSAAAGRPCLGSACQVRQDSLLASSSPSTTTTTIIKIITPPPPPTTTTTTTTPTPPLPPPPTLPPPLPHHQALFVFGDNTLCCLFFHAMEGMGQGNTLCIYDIWLISKYSTAILDQ